jgi:hypothetical protein
MGTGASIKKEQRMLISNNFEIRKKHQALFSVADDAIDGVDRPAVIDDTKTKDGIPSPSKFLAAGYQIAAMLNVVTAMSLAYNYPNPTMNAASILSTTGATSSNLLTRYQPKLLATYAAGTLGHLFLAGGSCHVLAESARTKRLFTSDTYKRLTFGTLVFGLISLWSLPGEVGCNSTFGTGVIVTMVAAQITKFVTALVSFVGWEYSAGGYETGNRVRNSFNEIYKGCKRVWKSLPVTDKRPATFYRTFFLLVTIFNPLCNIPELTFNLRQCVGLFSLPVSLNISSIARLGLLSVILYVLKDAAERDRLNGSTFIKLNLSVGLWAFGVGIAQGFGNGDFNVRRAADKLLFAVLFLNNGIISILQNMSLMQRENPDSGGEPPLRVNLF